VVKINVSVKVDAETISRMRPEVADAIMRGLAQVLTAQQHRPPAVNDGDEETPD
jgi:hypothetical protein